MCGVGQCVTDTCHRADCVGAWPQVHLFTQELVAGLLLGHRVRAGLALAHVQDAGGLELHRLWKRTVVAVVVETAQYSEHPRWWIICPSQCWMLVALSVAACGRGLIVFGV